MTTKSTNEATEPKFTTALDFSKVDFSKAGQFASTVAHKHPAFDADNCPACGTSRKIGR